MARAKGGGVHGSDRNAGPPAGARPSPPPGWALAVLDALSVTAAVYVAYLLRAGAPAAWLPHFGHPLSVYTEVLPEIVVLWLATGYTVGLYRTPVDSPWAQLWTTVRAGLFGFLVLAGAAFLSHFDYSRVVLVLAGVCATAFQATTRCLLAAGYRRRRSAGGPVRAVIVGTGELGRLVAERLAGAGAPGYDLLGFVATGGRKDDGGGGAEATGASAVEDAEEAGYVGEGGDVLGPLGDLPSLLGALGVEEVFIAAPDLDDDRVMAAVDGSQDSRVVFRLASGPLQSLNSPGLPGGPGGLMTIDLPGPREPAWALRAAKRLADVVVSALLLLVLSPLMLAVAWLVRRESGASALFVQERVGHRGKPFAMLKFRTMAPDAAHYAPGPESRDDPRVTPVGRWLRRSSLDELPQLINVLRGDMSLVGPRPEMPFLVERYRPWQRRRLDAKPGITGLWQIMGRKDLPLIENIEYDFYYLRHQSLLLDVQILLRTLAVVVGGRGAY